jgi:predicted secreted protein
MKDLETLKEGELRPCPFCGGRASATGTIRYDEKHQAWFSDGTRVIRAFFCSCTACGITNTGLLGHQTRDKAIAAWNRRPSLPEGEAPSLTDADCDEFWAMPMTSVNDRMRAIYRAGWNAALSAVLPGGNEGANIRLAKIAGSLAYLRSLPCSEGATAALAVIEEEARALAFPSPSQPGQG